MTALLSAFLVLSGLAALALWLLTRGGRVLQFLLSATILAVLSALLVGVGALGLSFIFSKPLPGMEKLANWAVRFLYPVAQRLCRLLGIGTDALAQSFIAMNNRLVRLRAQSCRPEKLLLLLPHCLQWSQCTHKLNTQAEGCMDCGRCQMGQLLTLACEYGIRLALSTGGTLARKEIAQLKPQCVVAVACERDLLSGIIETPLPVMGVLNQRPQGPCHDTRVDLPQIRSAIELFLSGR